MSVDRHMTASRGAARRADIPSRVPIVDRLKRLLVQGLVLAGLAAVLVGASYSGLYLTELRVERIAITGSAPNVDVAAVEEVVAPHMKSGFLTVDLEDIRAELDAMPWVYASTVRRRWPDTVAIHIEEQRPIARWGVQGFLNHEGEFFPGDTGGPWAGLPVLEGPDGTETTMMRQYQTLEALLSDTELQVVWLFQDGVGQINAELGNGIFLALGNDQQVERVRRFVTLYEEHLSGLPVARVDLRYENGAAVKLLDERLAMTEAGKEEAY